MSIQGKVRRIPERGRYDRETVHAIFDAAFVCHVGFDVDGQPYVVPMLYARTGDSLLLHGSVASRLQQHLGDGARICVTVTLIDALVLARSAFAHSANYRSVMAFGTVRALEKAEEKAAALDLYVDRLLPGRREALRPMTRKEIAATSVLEFRWSEASAKVRSGPPVDKEGDRGLEMWAGLLPLETTFTAPLPDDASAGRDRVPEHVQRHVGQAWG